MAGITNPTLLDIPDPIETARLLLRAPSPAYADTLHEAVRESLPELIPFMPWASETYSLPDARYYLHWAASRYIIREALPMLIFHRETGEFIGSTGLERINWDVPRMEIGYWLRTSWVGQGYVTEAVAALTAFAFETLGAERVEIRMDATNVRSRAVAERSGYVLEARLRHYTLNPAGELIDELVFALLRAEYQAQTKGDL
ncbi:MAG: GNAT family N-acetyltransferase [Chloroflexi bacterium]|nr:GNAT family N-acetyltransferase [Chloroflexota bacterium]